MAGQWTRALQFAAIIQWPKASMHDLTRLTVKILMLFALLAGGQTLAGQPVVSATYENPAGTPSSSATEVGQAGGYFRSPRVDAQTEPADPESNSGLWLLLGAVGLGLGFFWLGRRAGAPATPTRAPRIVHPVARTGAAENLGARVNAGSEADSKYWTPLDHTTTVTVDELSSIEEEAEVFLLLGRMDMAIGVLRHYVESNDAAPAHIWMSLLDILHAQGLRQEFEKLAIEIRERFNVALPTWEGANARSNELTGLEHFPHLLAKITSHWNKPDCLDYLHGLTQDNRNGERGGFHLEAFRDLLMLIGMLEHMDKLAATQSQPV